MIFRHGINANEQSSHEREMSHDSRKRSKIQ